jgi:hypothetical protein
MDVLTLATLDHNGLRYSLVAHEIDPAAFDRHASLDPHLSPGKVEVPARVVIEKIED